MLQARREGTAGRRRLPVETFVIGLVACVACAHYSPSARALPVHIRTIAVPLFENTTVESGIKEALTDSILTRFLRDNQLKVVDEPDADSILRGTIVEVREEALSFSQGQTTRESRIWIYARIRYEDVRNQKILWEEPLMQSWGVFQVVTGTDADRQAGIAAAIKKMADDILNKTVAGW